jgi:glycine/D-amino acid oxidase-like deaminating enzyme
MVVGASPARPPRRVVVVGAGMVGLATAWFLQEHGVDVTVVDATGVAGGSSWGNAGWITPGIAAPLPEPGVLRYGLRAVLSPSSPVYVPPAPDPRLLAFLAGFARHCTTRRWMRSMRAMIPINRRALESFDLLEAGGVRAATVAARPLLAAYPSRRESQTMLAEIEHLRAAGQDIGYQELSGEQARELQPALSDAVGAAIDLHGQRFLDPGAYVHALADSVRGRGGTIHAGREVTGVHDSGRAVRLALGAGPGPAADDGDGDGDGDEFDAAVLATGVHLGGLARAFGVRAIVQAGRGYSFSVPMAALPTAPLYFPAARVAATPIGGRLRVAGMMEFRAPGAPLDQRRVQAIVEAVRPFLRGADLDDRRDHWVGARPCTIDGLPLIGATRSPRVFVAGGHGMWGMTLGPATGRLLATQIATGRRPPELDPFDPRRCPAAMTRGHDPRP